MKQIIITKLSALFIFILLISSCTKPEQKISEKLNSDLNKLYWESSISNETFGFWKNNIVTYSPMSPNNNNTLLSNNISDVQSSVFKYLILNDEIHIYTEQSNEPNVLAFYNSYINSVDTSSVELLNDFILNNFNLKIQVKSFQPGDDSNSAQIKKANQNAFIEGQYKINNILKNVRFIKATATSFNSNTNGFQTITKSNN